MIDFSFGSGSFFKPFYFKLMAKILFNIKVGNASLGGCDICAANLKRFWC